MKTSNWWYESTFDQRYQQVVEGRDLGMTEEQVAANLKVQPIVIKWFARDHKIVFKPKKKQIDESIGDDVGLVAADVMLDDVLDVDDTDYMEIVMETFGDVFTSAFQSIMDD